MQLLICLMASRFDELVLRCCHLYNFVVDVQDYLDHVALLEDRYLRTYGEVLTFGSGDCGQLAHGIDEDEDLMVKYPRTILSLRLAPNFVGVSNDNILPTFTETRR